VSQIKDCHDGWVRPEDKGQGDQHQGSKKPSCNKLSDSLASIPFPSLIGDFTEMIKDCWNLYGQDKSTLLLVIP